MFLKSPSAILRNLITTKSPKAILKLPAVANEEKNLIRFQRFFINAMETEDIVKNITKISSRLDLLNLINSIMKEDFADKEYSFSYNQFRHFCNPNKYNNRFINFEIPKKSGGIRVISAPNEQLKTVLHYLNIILKAMYHPSGYVFGFVQGKSVKDNAFIHINKNYVFNIDLQDFFPSIKQARVWKRLQLPPFNFNKDVAWCIAGLCCMKVINTNENKEQECLYVLPQGAPTSPIITNMICDNLDRRLNGLAKRFRLSYSRYADDITFSSNHNVFQDNSDFRIEFTRIITEQGF
ncbi:RNA-directed DNA polymerase, partial [bacterium]|nr:RNA-directed DNA polymerase [bacterium]